MESLDPALNACLALKVKEKLGSLRGSATHAAEISAVSRNSITAAAQMGLIVRWRLEPTPESWLPLQPRMDARPSSSTDPKPAVVARPPEEPWSRENLPGGLVGEFLETEKNRNRNMANGGNCSGAFDDYSLCKVPAVESITNRFLAMMAEKVFKRDLSHILPESLLVECRYGAIDLLKMLKSGFLDAACAGDPSGNCSVFEGTGANLREVFDTSEGKLLQVFTSHKYSESYNTSSRVLGMVDAGNGLLISQALSPLSMYSQRVVADFPERRTLGEGVRAIVETSAQEGARKRRNLFLLQDEQNDPVAPEDTLSQAVGQHQDGRFCSS
eukprot:4280091-Amphidinium_carterae.1